MKTFLSLIALFCIGTIKAQNLVPNPGFEVIEGCPQKFGEFMVKDWESIKVTTTPDLLSNCAKANFAINPSNEMTRLLPVEGQSYAGIVIKNMDKHHPLFSEGIYTQLDFALDNGSSYQIELDLGIPVFGRYLPDTIRVYLTSVSPEEGFFGEAYNCVSAAISLDSLNPSKGWKKFTVNLNARGGERYLVIANLDSPKEIVATQIPGRTGGDYEEIFNVAYVCIDNVSVTQVATKREVIRKTIVVAEEPKLEPTPPLILDNLNFATNSAILEDQDIPELEEFIEQMIAYHNYTIVVSGHTDNLGKEELNQPLSERRAEAVARYISNHGIAAYRIISKGYGSAKPYSTNDTEEGRRKNRRVEVKFEGN